MKRLLTNLCFVFVLAIIISGCKGPTVNPGTPFIQGPNPVSAGETERYTLVINNGNISGCQYFWSISGDAQVIATSGLTADIEFFGNPFFPDVQITVNVINCSGGGLNGTYQRTVTVN